VVHAKQAGMHYTNYKTILSPKNHFNIYRGCSHGCIYCDTRSKCYQFTHNFEDIEIKNNAVKILESELRKKRNLAMLTTGSMCDPYIPLEKELEITRNCLKIISTYGFGISILTKSDLILRDLDIIKEINRNTKCVVNITLTTYDDNLCKIIEPTVAVTSERFKVLEIMRDNGIPTVVWFCPLLPFINDTEENVRGIMEYCVRAKTKGVIFFGIGTTLREGSREYFYANLDKSFPGLREVYEREFGNRYEIESCNSHKLYGIIKETCSRNGMMCGVNDNFKYLTEFPVRQQLTF
jgi:DNA repair photolyase